MAPTWLVGLYAPAKDLISWLANRRPPKVAFRVEVNSLGSQSWLAATAESLDDSLIAIRGCYADIYVSGFDSCAEPYPIRTRAINFRPSGHSQLPARGEPVRWEAQVSHEHLRRIERDLCKAETIEIYGRHGPEILRLQEEGEQASWRQRNQFFPAFLRALLGSDSVKIRIVLESGDGKEIAAHDALIPPPSPFVERFYAALSHTRSVAQARRDKNRQLAANEDNPTIVDGE